ncbi:MAG: nuclear transport factor 2 family protein [Bacteroidales bacterium]|nr:nuclear transport factor 2 family protein [Bacteroidales bacterium]
MKTKYYALQTACFITIIFIMSLSCNNSENGKTFNKETEIKTVTAAIHNSIGWAKNKDFRLLYSVIANDSDYIEVDPGAGVIRGFNEFKKNETFWGNPEFKAIKYEIRDLTINLSEKGEVAWFYCILDDINEWKGKPASWMNTRWTGVLEKRKDKWIMVQMHFSFAKE